MNSPHPILPVQRPVSGAVRPPGSKSLTNRALIVSALAEGTSQLSGVLESDDTRVMVASLQQLGVAVEWDREQKTIGITGCAGRPPAAEADLWLQNSGTSIRFLTALCALGHGTYRLDGNERMRERPIGDLVTALRQLGTSVDCAPETMCPPVTVHGTGLAGGEVTVSGDVSSQFLSGLLMAAPCAADPVTITVRGILVSQPYVTMTLEVMRAFGVSADTTQSGQYRIPPATYRGTRYAIEPDASAASYFFAAAAITGGRITVEGLTRNALQGDVAFVEVLQQMGCMVEYADDSITVTGAPLRGVDVDMNAISDTAQTLAVVAVFAEGPTRIRNVGHMRHKETDRVSAVVTELRRAGINADEHDDGLTVHPGTVQPAVIETYDDHRMAMSFALLGLKHEGIEIADPGCTAKTYPNFFEDLESLCGTSR